MITVPLSVYRLRAAQRGSALIMVIFLIFMLGMIVYAMFNIVKHDADVAISQKQAFRARQVAEMGINWAMNPAIKPYDREFLEQTLPEDGAMFSTKIRGEGGKININAVLQQGENGREFMTALFRLWGVGVEDSQLRDDLFNNLLDWTDADGNSTHNGMEKRDYQQDERYGENTPYPFNRPFYDLKEMTLVPGFQVIVTNVPDWRDYFTIYSTGKVDLNSAEAKVLAAVAVAIRNPGDPVEEFNRLMEPNNGANAVLADRWGPDKTEDTQDDKPLTDANWPDISAYLDIPAPGQGDDPQTRMVTTIFGFENQGNQTTRIECVATVGDYRKRVVLVVRGRTGQPQILSREEIPIFE